METNKLKRQQQTDAVRSKEDVQAVKEAMDGTNRRAIAMPASDDLRMIDEEEAVEREEMLNDEEQEAADDAATAAE